MLAHLYAELERHDEARQPFERLAESRFAELPRNDEWVFGMALLADVAGFLGDASASEILYDELLPYERWNAVSAPDACIGAVARSLGVVATAAGRYDEAGRHFENALAMNTKTGGRTWVAQTQLDYARLLLERGDPADREPAAALLATCRDSAQALGSDGLVSKAEALASKLGVPT